jgi:hypothetical protein
MRHNRMVQMMLIMVIQTTAQSASELEGAQQKKWTHGKQSPEVLEIQVNIS